MSVFRLRHDLWYARLPRSPRGRGTVHRCVVRTGPGRRATPDAIEVSPGVGVAGDCHGAYEGDGEKNEVSLINVHVVRALARGDEERMSLSGDNLQVDLDLSEEGLPAGTRLRVGTALLEVTDQPHRPCRSFAERYGTEGAKRVARANERGLRGRGVLCRVVRAGTIRAGDSIEVGDEGGPGADASPLESGFVVPDG